MKNTFIREKAIHCGKDFLMPEIFPYTGRQQQAVRGRRKKKIKVTEPAQKNLNDRRERFMTSIPQMDPRLSHAVQCSLNRAPGSLYDLKKVKVLNDFSYCGDPYYQTVQPSQEQAFEEQLGKSLGLWCRKICRSA